MAKATETMFSAAFDAIENMVITRGFDPVERQQLYMALLQFNGCVQTQNMILAAELCETAGIEMGRRLREIAEKGKNAALLEAGGGLPAAQSVIELPREQPPIKLPPVDIILPH